MEMNKSTARMAALARYYEMVTALERSLNRSFRGSARTLAGIHQQIECAYVAHSGRTTKHESVLYQAVCAGQLAMKVEGYINVEHNAMLMHRQIDGAGIA